MNERDELRLRHMRDAAVAARNFAQGRSQSDLDDDLMFVFAILHGLQIIGEAAGNISQETRDLSPQIAWKSITGMRHRLVHDYDAVDLEIVWHVVTDEIPTLIEQLDYLLDQIDSDLTT